MIELEDQTVVEVDTPPFAGDGWRLRLENIAKGGKDHYLQLKVQTENGLRIAVSYTHLTLPTNREV